MPLSPEDFYTHAIAAADDEQRLPLSRMTGWDISPCEAEGLRVSQLRPPVVPEPPRHGEDPAAGPRARSGTRFERGLRPGVRHRMSRPSTNAVQLRVSSRWP